MGRKLVLLGSTGSIGTQTLDVVRNNESLSVIALAANKNVALMEEQVRQFHPKYAAMYDEAAAKDLKQRVQDLPVKVLSGPDGLMEVVSAAQADTVLTALVGMIGIRFTIAAIKAGKDILLANKETLVCAGHLIMPLAAACHVQIIPVDSEHSAIFQCLKGQPANRLEKILLTASGGPFRGMKREELEKVTVDQALNNPNWSMGAKVTIDSASLVNKGLEVMEAKWLFGCRLDQIQVVVQPQSVVHSAVQFCDGSILAHLSVADMREHIQYALFYPDRMPMLLPRLDLFKLGSITFEKPDTDTFEGLPLAFAAAREGGSMPTVLNAANEVAVDLFLKGKIRFLQIYDMLREAMDAHHTIQDPGVDQILETQKETEEFLHQKFV